VRIPVKILLVTLSVFVLMAVISGCPKAPSDVEAPPMLEMPPPEAVPDEAASAEPGTLAEALNTVTAPDSYEMTMTIDDKDMVQLVALTDGVVVKVVIKDETGTIFIDMAEKTMIAYNPEDKTATSMPMGEGEDMPVVGTDMLDQDVEIIATEDVDGVACWVVETTAKGKDEKAKIWIDKETGLMRKGDADGETMVFKYDRINEVADDEFDLPAGVEVTDLSDVMGGAEQD